LYPRSRRPQSTIFFADDKRSFSLTSQAKAFQLSLRPTQLAGECIESCYKPTCTYPAHLRRDSETIVAQVNSVGDGRQPSQCESYECIKRTHHGILRQRERVRLAGRRETRLRGKQAEGGRFLKLMLNLCAVGRWAPGPPINIVIRRRWDSACECVKTCERDCHWGEASLCPDRAVGPRLRGRQGFIFDRDINRWAEVPSTCPPGTTPQVEFTVLSGLLGGRRGLLVWEGYDTCQDPKSCWLTKLLSLLTSSAEDCRQQGRYRRSTTTLKG
jgi:hypothetical protein